MSIDQALSASALSPAKTEVAGQIKRAAGSTGASFEYMLAAAKIESNLDPKAAAPTSSARGLYQFIEQTWLGTVKEAGGKFGYGQYADSITRTASGRYEVSDPVTRAEILKLRNDPAANAAMAGVLTQSNSFKLVGQIGRRPTDAELYMAHFMGVRGASRLIKNAEQNPSATGASLFPAAAESNRSIFYDRAGRARSVSEVYGVLNARYASAVNAPVTQNALASLGGTTSAPTTVAAVNSATNVGGAPPRTRGSVNLAAFPDLDAISVASRLSAPGGQQVASAQDSKPAFRTLFTTGDRAEPVSQTVRDLWSNSPPQPLFDSRSNRARPLDLFSDRDGAFSG